MLEVGDEEPFVSRPMMGTPTPTARCNEHLLDGQQRLTALWRSLNDDYEDRTWLVRTEPDEEHAQSKVVVVGQSRWQKNGERYPQWVDKPAELWAKRFIPARLLRPDDIQPEIRSWGDAATENDVIASRDLEGYISRLRLIIQTYNIPFLSLPPATPRDVALDVFIKLNTSSVPLTAFDIVVASLNPLLASRCTTSSKRWGRRRLKRTTTGMLAIGFSTSRRLVKTGRRHRPAISGSILSNSGAIGTRSRKALRGRLSCLRKNGSSTPSGCRAWPSYPSWRRFTSTCLSNLTNLGLPEEFFVLSCGGRS